MPSFDVVSKVDWAEISNALNQAQKELSQRFDFKGAEASVERNEAGILVLASTDDRVRAALAVLQEKLIRRKVSLLHLEFKNPEKAPKGSSRLQIKVKEGIEQEKSKEIIKLIKDKKLKVQASIQEQSLRISGKKKDDLQEAIALLRASEDLGLDLQFTNFRD
jgi:cyclic-di-GMP-binding protein